MWVYTCSWCQEPCGDDQECSRVYIMVRGVCVDLCFPCWVHVRNIRGMLRAFF
jgi:hypothetical protein